MVVFVLNVHHRRPCFLNAFGYFDHTAEEIRQECAKLSPTALPKSALGKAVHYTLNMWPKLRRCFEYAEVELSNNLAENSMRPVALGRKNWLHVGSAKAGPKVAAILSIVESCRSESR